MIQPSVALLFAIASCRWYEPKPAEAEDCANLAKLGFVQPVKQGKLDGYAIVLKGTKYVRSYMGYERNQA